jgi:branched-chain amino acid transport system substrate-binding protein
MKKFLAITSFVIFMGCKAKTINIYVLLSLTGAETTYGKQAKDGIELLLEKIEKKSIKGRKIDIIIKDTKSDIEEVKRIIEEIKKDENALCIVGPEISKLAIVAGAVADKKGIVLITPTATHPFVTEDRNYVFRLSYTDPIQGAYLAKFAIHNLNKKKGCILFEANNPYSEELARQFEATFKKEGGEILYSTFYLRGDTLFDSQIESFKKFNPEVVFIPGYIREVIDFVKNSYNKGLKTTYLGGDGWHSPELITMLKEIWDKGISAYITSPFSPEDPSEKTKNFVKDFKKKYNRVPEVVSALYYDALSLVVFVLEKTEKIDIENFRKTLLNLEKFEGVTGIVRFKGKRDPERDVFILKPSSEGFKYVTKLHF